MADAAVVIPFRGRWSTLLPLLEALALQTVRQRLSVILSVDGTEKPPAEIASLTDLVVTGEQAGPAAARNRGWRRADAPLILFTDGDCVPEPRWAEELIHGLGGEYQGVKGVYSRGGTRAIQRLAQVEFEERYLIMAKGNRSSSRIPTPRGSGSLPLKNWEVSTRAFPFRNTKTWTCPGD